MTEGEDREAVVLSERECHFFASITLNPHIHYRSSSRTRSPRETYFCLGCAGRFFARLVKQPK